MGGRSQQTMLEAPPVPDSNLATNRKNRLTIDKIDILEQEF